MSIRLDIAVVVFLWSATHAFAHRVDEYLQATTVAVEAGRVTLQVRLTPGVEVARKVLSTIDADGDGAISAAEQHAYAMRVGLDLSVTLDGKPLGLRLVSTTPMVAEELTRGTSSILLDFEADAPPGGPARRLTLENHHRGDIAVYLVNCLRPRDPDLHVASQHRNYDQSFYQLDFNLGDDSGSRQAPPSGTRPGPGPYRTIAFAVLETYFRRGVHHILTGYDHLLFVSILVLAAPSLWDLVKVVTAFTLAHSITLTLSALYLARLPGWVVEPMIAGSIVFVASQNLFWPKSSRGRSRLAAAFFFGLFHGMGFAGGLIDIMQGLPTWTILQAILGFSVGVEVGHQIVLLPLFGFLTVARRIRRCADERDRLATILQKIGSTIALAAGLYYVCVTLSSLFH